MLDPRSIRQRAFPELGHALQSYVPEIIDSWESLARRDEDFREDIAEAHSSESSPSEAATSTSTSTATHQEILRNELPDYLKWLGQELEASGTEAAGARYFFARDHGKQRWQTGWNLDEVVRDYQFLRITLLSYLAVQLGRSLSLEENLAIGVLLDDAIEDAVSAYVRFQDESLSETEVRSRGTFENAAVGIAHVDLVGRWLQVNQRLCDTLGYECEDLKQLTLPHVTHAQDQELLQEQLGWLLEGDLDHFTIEQRLIHRAGVEIWVQLTVSLQRSTTGSPAYFILIAEDITDRIQLDEDLKEAKAKAEEASRLKSEFVANVSHEIRTPMNAILGMTELALDEPLASDVRDYLTTAQDSAKSLLALVNDILDFSKIEAGRLELESTPFDLWELASDASRTLVAPASDKGLELLVDVAPNVPRVLKGDALRLRQVITNLVGNAVKFTERGEIQVSAELLAETSSHAIVQFSVRDTGIGISHEDQARICAPFTQADASTTRVFGGSGLGLAICTELISRMGGQLSIKSELGVGSRFQFTSRFEKARDLKRRSEQRRQEKLARLTDLKVMLVDDNASARRILQKLLTRIVQRVDVAENGELLEQMRLAQEAQHPYDVVLIDALMPSKDGFTYIQDIRESFGRSSELVLMMSSADRSAFIEQCRELQIDQFLDKPATFDGVVNALHAVCVGGDVAGDDTHGNDNYVTKLRVLVVEDTPANQKVVKAILAKRGHEVTVANNGREAIDKLFIQHFDVVLMDVQMPTVDGYQATAAIRKMEDVKAASIPIIAMTAHALRGDAEKCLAAGMNAYLAKPIDSRQLIELTESLGNQHQDTQSLRREDGQESSGHSRLPDKELHHSVEDAGEMDPKNSSHARSNESGQSNAGTQTSRSDDKAAARVDWDGAIARLGNSVELYRDMVNFFREDVEPILESLERGLNEKDAELARRSCHSIKGLAAGIGSLDVPPIAERLERLADEHQLDAVESELPHFRNAIDLLKRALDQKFPQ